MSQGIACILGTGSNSGYYNGRAITRNSPGLGYVLGDEGSGAYLGKRVLQYFLYNTFDEELRAKFESQYTASAPAILDAVYKQPLPNRYMASFAHFLSENRGHFILIRKHPGGRAKRFLLSNTLCKYRERLEQAHPLYRGGGPCV